MNPARAPGIECRGRKPKLNVNPPANTPRAFPASILRALVYALPSPEHSGPFPVDPGTLTEPAGASIVGSGAVPERSGTVPERPGTVLVCSGALIVHAGEPMAHPGDALSIFAGVLCRNILVWAQILLRITPIPPSASAKGYGGQERWNRNQARPPLRVHSGTFPVLVHTPAGSANRFPRHDWLVPGEVLPLVIHNVPVGDDAADKTDNGLVGGV
jgi:hypothetical protein